MVMMYIVNKTNSRQIVDIRFTFKGHTFLPNDSYLGSIKKKIEAKELLYSIEDYVEAIGQCHSYKKEKQGGKKRLIVQNMKREEFKNSALDELLMKKQYTM